jgi:diguanylate cyclase (GGDEF)-like protein/PAS domain S-box-containing protein
MKEKHTVRLLPRSGRNRTPLTLISAVVTVAIAACLYLSFAWFRYDRMARLEAAALAQSVASLMHVEHIAALTGETEDHNAHLVEQSLRQLVEVTDSIYYAYILRQDDGGYTIVSDSSSADTTASRPTKRSCEETAEANRIPFETGRHFITGPISTPCGDWIRALVPIFDSDSTSVIALLGLSYAASEWRGKLWNRMIPDVIVVFCLSALAFTLVHLLRRNVQLRAAEESRQESERSKSVFFAQLPGMAYRCKNDPNWTMEFVSEGSLELTGHKAESFILNRDISYNAIISPEYRDLVREEWNRVVLQRKRYRGQYEIITKSGERKWVLELGQAIYADDGKAEALEGIVLDISDQKEKDRQIAHLRKHDFLTGLYNRSFLEQERQRLDQGEYWPLSVVICDIDGLRVINDAYGQDEGDYLIIKTGQLIQNRLRDTDVLAHTGGGEFIVLLPRTDGQAAYDVVSDVESSIDSYNRTNERSLYTISVSIGYSTKEGPAQDMQAVVNEAHEHLRRRKMLNQNSSHSAIVASIMAALYAKSQETEEHGQRLGRLSTMIGRELDLGQSDLDALELLSKLHDIGKIGIDDYILNKPSHLSEEEWAIMKQHPEIGHRIAMTSPQLRHIAPYILYHHERWDGGGYPMGLRDKEIPLIARILAVADAFDAMTQDRVYRKALPLDDALTEIERNAGTQFDPEIAELFVGLIRERGENWLEEDLTG